jgi:hypothetical protein
LANSKTSDPRPCMSISERAIKSRVEIAETNSPTVSLRFLNSFKSAWNRLIRWSECVSANASPIPGPPRKVRTLQESLSAIITGSCSIVAGVGGALVGQWNNIRWLGIPSDRQKVLSGKWRGKLIEEATPNQPALEMTLECDITVSRRKVTGTCQATTLLGTDILQDTYKLTGGFIYHNFIKFDYISVKQGEVQFGSAILEHLPAGTVLEGRSLGYGASAKSLVLGTIMLTKVP